MSSLEKRLISRVQPLKSQASTPISESSILTELPHNHQKGRQCRSCRTLRKIAKEEKEKTITSIALREGTDLLKELILAGGYTTGQAFNAAGQIAGNLAGNPDVVSQAVAIGGGIVFLAWFITAFPGIAKFFRLDTLKFSGLDLAAKAQIQNEIDKAKVTTDKVVKDLEDQGKPVPPELKNLQTSLDLAKLDTDILNAAAPFIPLGGLVQLAESGFAKLLGF